MNYRARFKGKESPEPEQVEITEPEVEIQLTTSSVIDNTRICYDFPSGQYKHYIPSDLLFHLLSLPSKVIHKEDLQLQALQQTKSEDEVIKEEPEENEDKFYLLHLEMQRKKEEEKRKKEEEERQNEQEPFDVARDLEELYGSVMSPEELAKLDSQPNPFNFSERVSQTMIIPRKDLSLQTDQPPNTTFGVTVGLHIVHDAYERDYNIQLAKEHQRQIDKMKEEEEQNDEKHPANKKEPSTPKFQKPGSAKPQTKVQGTTGPPDPLIVVPKVQEGPNECMEALQITSTMIERTLNQNNYDDIIQDYKYWEDSSDDYRPLEGSLLPLWKLSGPRTRELLVSDVCWSPSHPDLLAAAYTPSGNGKSDGMFGVLCIYSLNSPGVPERIIPTTCGITSIQFHPQRECVLAAGGNDGTVLVYDAHRAKEPRIITSTTITGKHLLPVSQISWLCTDPGQSLVLYSVAEDGRVTQWALMHDSLQPTDVFTFRNEVPSKKTYSLQKNNLEGTATCLAIKPDNKNVILLGVDNGLVVELCLTSTHALVRYPAHTASVRAVIWNPHHSSVFASCSLDWMLKIWFRHHKGYLVTFKLSPNLRRVPKEAKGADENKLREIETAKIERIIETAKLGRNS